MDLSIMKAIIDGNQNVTEMMEFVFNRIEIIAGKEENSATICSVSYKATMNLQIILRLGYNNP